MAVEQSTRDAGSPPTETSADDRRQRLPHHFRGRLGEALSYRRIGALYVLVAIAVIFTLLAPETFPTIDTVQQVLNSNAIVGLAALALVVPLAAGVFDLSFAYTMSLSGVIAAELVVGGMPLAPAIGGALVAAVVVALVNGLLVVRLGIDSFIATLAVGSLIQAVVTLITGDADIVGLELAGSFSDISQTQVLGLALPVYYLLVFGFVAWYLLQHTPTGRRLYAIGFNPEAARLAGARVDRLRLGTLMWSSLLAGFAGVILASSVRTGNPTAGIPYLLPAFAAAFLGATQIRPGRFNSWGTLIAVVVLGTGVTGLGLAAAPPWTGAMFTGVVLVAALAISTFERRKPEVGMHGREPAGDERPAGRSLLDRIGSKR